MSHLRGKRILVAGGTGDVGAGIVQALLGSGATTIVPARATAKADRLRREVGGGDRLQILEGDVGTVSSAGRLADEVAAGGPLHGAVISLGGWWQGPELVKVSAEDWDSAIGSNLTSHFAVACAFLPLLRGQGGTLV